MKDKPNYLELEKDEELRVPDHWKIVSKNVNMATVTDGKRQGTTPIKHHGDDFKCFQCGYYGPWNGVICLTCGQRTQE
jgi:hypothetical protein